MVEIMLACLGWPKWLLLSATLAAAMSAASLDTCTHPSTLDLSMLQLELNTHPSTSNVTVVSLFTGEAINAWAVARKNHEDYCRMHKYDYVAPLSDDEATKYLNGRRGGWAKIGLLLELLQNKKEGAHFFWMDGDSLFMNKRQSLQRFIDYNRDLVIAGDKNGLHTDLVIAGDENGLNTGHFMLRNTQWSRTFLAGVWKIFPNLAFQFEQSSVVAMIGGANPDDNSTWRPAYQHLDLSLVTEHEVQVFEGQLDGKMFEKVKVLVQSSMNSKSHWKQGDFIYHVAGGGNAATKRRELERVNSIGALQSNLSSEYGKGPGHSHLDASGNATSHVLAVQALLEHYAKMAH